MEQITIAIVLFAIFTGFWIHRNVYNPLTLFFCLLLVLIVPSSMNLYGTYQVGQYTYTVICLGLVGFFLGYLLMLIVMQSLFERRETEPINYKYSIRHRTVSLTFIFVVLFLSYSFFRTFTALSQGYTMVQIRNGTVNLGSFSALYSLADQYIVRPIVLALISIATITFFTEKKSFIVRIFIVVLFTAFSTGGRFIFLYLIIQFTVGMFVLKKINMRKSTKYKLSLLFVVCMAIILIITNLRITDGDSYLKHFYLYTGGSIAHLDYRLNTIKYANTYTYGINFFSGYLTPLFVLLNGIGFRYPDFYLRAINAAFVEDVVYIGSNIRYNAFVTPFFYFYLDGGKWGVFIGSLLYGSMLGLSYWLMKKNKSILGISIYLILIQGVLTSMVRWQFIIPSYALSFIYLRAFLKKRIDFV